jgi:hypothetical protein
MLEWIHLLGVLQKLRLRVNLFPRAMKSCCLSASWKCGNSWRREVLEKEFPESASRVTMYLPDEKTAASLPKIRK